MNASEAKKIMKMGDTFSKSELKKQFRKLSLEKHPDTGGSSELFIQLEKSYKILEFIAIANYTDNEELFISGKNIKEYGCGLPNNVNAKTCENCNGLGYKQFDNYEFCYCECEKCQGTGVHFYKCKKCYGTGIYFGIGKTKGCKCKSCKGTGKFFPKYNSKLPPSIFIIDGVKTKVNRCELCRGSGEIFGRRKTKYYLSCDMCDGIGEIQIYNPVLPKGLLIDINT